MAATPQIVTLDVNQISMFRYLNAKQADSGRRLKARITVDGQPYKVPTTATVTFRAVKPDDKVIYDSGSINSDGSINVTISAQTLAVVGKVFADISIVDGGKTVSTVSFVILVDELKGAASIVSSSSFTALQNLVSSLSSYDTELARLESTKADGPGIEVILEEDILTVNKTT